MKIMEKLKSRFDSVVDKTINHVSPKVQKEIKNITKKATNNTLDYALTAMSGAVSAIFIFSMARSLAMPVTPPTATQALDSVLARGVCIVYNDVTYNYYNSKEA